MKRAILVVSAWAAAIVIGCDKNPVAPTTGSISLRVVRDEPVSAATSTPEPSVLQAAAGHLDAARVRVSGPTNKSLDLTATPSGFSGTVDGLAPGPYTVLVEGLVAGEVDYFGQTSGVQVRVGENTGATVTFSSFRALLDDLGPPTAGMVFTARWSRVANAQSYRVERDKNPGFPSPSSTAVTDTFASISVTDTGTYNVRVRAVNTWEPAGRASDPKSIWVVGAPPPLQNGVAMSGLAGTAGSQRYFAIPLPSAQSQLTINLSGGTGDANLYVRRDSLPTQSRRDCESVKVDNSEQCSIPNPPAGNWYVLLQGRAAYSGVSLAAAYWGPPTQMTANNSALSQSGMVGTTVAIPPAVVVRDAGSNPVPNVAVTFTVTAGGGATVPASPAVVNTNASGIAALTSWTLGPTAGANNNTLTASASGPSGTPLAGSPMTFTASGTPPPGTKQWVGGASGGPSDWSNPANWSSTGVPTSTDAVRIGAAQYQPVLSTAAQIGKLTIESGGRLTLAGHTLTVSDSLSTFDGVLVMTNPSDVLEAQGHVLFANTSTPNTQLTAGVIRVQGNFRQTSSSSQGFAASGTHKVEFSGTTPLTVQFDDPVNCHFQDVEFANSREVRFITNATVNGTVRISGDNTVTSQPGVTVAIGGDLLGAGGDWQVTNTIFTGAPNLPPTLTTNVTFTGRATLLDNLQLTGNLTIRTPVGATPAQLALAGHMLTVSDSFSTFDGVLVMANGADVLEVGGHVLFSNGQPNTQLTAGVLRVKGNFRQSFSGSQGFAASGTNTVVFNGTTPQVVHFDDPLNSHFQNLELGTPGGSLILETAVSASGQLLSTTGVAPTVSGRGNRLTVSGVNVSSLVLDNAPFVIQSGTVTRFDNVTFQQFDPAATQLTINHPGAGTAFTFNNIAFMVTPTTGWYISANDILNDASTLTVNLANSLPADGSGKTITNGGAVVRWATSGPVIRLSAMSTTFTAVQGEASPAPQTLSVTNGGGGTLSGLVRGTISYDAGQPTGWLAASLDQPDAPATLTLSATTGGLIQGTYTATVPVISNVASNSPQNVVVSFTICASPQTISLGSTLSGTLTSSDCFAPHRSGSRADFYTLTGSVNQVVTIRMRSGFDTYLLLVGTDGSTLVAANDDCPGDGLNSCLNDVILPATGTYTIEATSYSGGATGAYTLELLGQWIPLAPTGTAPAPRWHHSAVYDPGSNRMITFGGGGFTSADFDDVWLLQNANGIGAAPSWIPLTLTPTPGARVGHSAVYDRVSNRMIVFGWSGDDVWVLTSANGIGPAPGWSTLSLAGPRLPTRAYHTAVYDPGSNRMIVFGGQAGDAVFNDVWVLTNANGGEPTASTWTQLVAAPGPSARQLHSAVYDPTSNRMMVFGGADRFATTFFDDAWVLTNANGTEATAPTWVQLSPPGARPSARWRHTGVYDPSSNTLVVYGGDNGSVGFDDVWLLRSANNIGAAPGWTQLMPIGPLPANRGAHTAVYDPGSNRMTVFAGDAAGALTNETWVLSRANGVFSAGVGAAVVREKRKR